MHAIPGHSRRISSASVAPHVSDVGDSPNVTFALNFFRATISTRRVQSCGDVVAFLEPGGST